MYYTHTLFLRYYTYLYIYYYTIYYYCYCCIIIIIVYTPRPEAVNSARLLEEPLHLLTPADDDDVGIRTR